MEWNSSILTCTWTWSAKIPFLLSNPSFNALGLTTWGNYTFHLLISRCLHVCCFVEYFDTSQEILDNDWNIKCSFGLHPHEAAKYTDKIEERIISAMKHPNCIAWGECGLDFFKNLSPPVSHWSFPFFKLKNHFLWMNLWTGNANRSI